MEKLESHLIRDEVSKSIQDEDAETLDSEVVTPLLMAHLILVPRQANYNPVRIYPTKTHPDD